MPDYAFRYTTARGRVMGALFTGEWTSWKALRQVGGVRYSARLLELRRLGYVIETRASADGEGKEYRLVSPVPSQPQAKRVKVFLAEGEVRALLEGRLLPTAESALRDALGSFVANRDKL